MSYKILFSNLGYAKGIDGSLRQHARLIGRHFYCALPVQEQILSQVKAIIDKEKPDLCCFVEIDSGSMHSARFNQIEALMDTEYCFHDIADKYGKESRLGRMLFHKGKSNAFLSKRDIAFERLYFRHGTKRLIYQLGAVDGVTILFAHFSLSRKVRIKQFEEVRQLVKNIAGEVVILADFNIMGGFRELAPLLEGGDLCVLNKEDAHTFTFHKHRLVLDLCICSKGLADKLKLQIIPQPFSDHAALLVEIH